MRFISLSPIFAICLLFSSCLKADEPPLCKGIYCDCSPANGTEFAKVICSRQHQNLVTNVSSWINQKNNQPYPYLEVTLSYQRFIELNFTFPYSNLTYLNLAHNNIYSIRDAVFKNLQNMRVLILSYNDLEILSPNAFRGLFLPERFEPLNSLRELRLDHNNLHTLNKDIFYVIGYLEILDLSHNPFKYIDWHTAMAIISLSFLKELYLGYTEITRLPDDFLHTFKYLSLLDLSGNPINVVPSALGSSRNLTTLYLHDTKFVSLTKENGFPDIPSLKILYICHSQELEDIGAESLSGLSGLEELHISDNIYLTYLDAFALAKINPKNGETIWPFLKKLYIRNNNLEYLDSNFLAKWDSLTDLDIQDNPWNCDNPWLIEVLMPIYLKIDEYKARHVKCGGPIEMVNYTLLELCEKNDVHGAKPDAVMLYGILAGELIAIILVLFAIFIYRRKWFGIPSKSDNVSPSSSDNVSPVAAKNEDL